MRTKIFKRKRFPVDQFYGGSQWFSITGESLEWMMNYLLDHKEYIDFFKHGVCTDEIFFLTLIRLSPYAINIKNNCLRFMIWEGSTSGGPCVLHENNIDEMLESECIFARKFEDIHTLQLIRKRLN